MRLKIPQFSFIFLYSAVLLGLMLAMHMMVRGQGGYFYDVAEAFLAGRLHLERVWTDLSEFGGRYYSPDGPLPAIILMPFAAVGWRIEFAFISVLAALTVFYFCFLLARRFDYSPHDACWLGVAFVFGSSFVNCSLLPWGFAHSAVVLCLFAAILETEGKRRMALVGLLVGIAMTSRATAGLTILAFLLAATAASGMLRLALPFGAVVALLALYNYARFGDPLETGYTYQAPFNTISFPGNIAGPAMSLANVPVNLKVFLSGLPDPQAVGTSALLVSPYLVYLWKVKWDRQNKLAAATCGLVLLAVLSFRSTGFAQVGYRFSLDFLPLVFWMLMRSRVPITRGFKALILAATLIDAVLVWYFLETVAQRR
jgi:hypothetical protein